MAGRARARSAGLPMRESHENCNVNPVGAGTTASPRRCSVRNEMASREWEAWHWNKNWLCGRGARTLASLPPLSACTLTISLHRAY
jgi:hypothetical protein